MQAGRSSLPPAARCGTIHGRGVSIATQIFKDDRHVPEQANHSKLQRRRLLLFLFGVSGTVLGLLVALVYVATAPPVYEATAFADVDRISTNAEAGIYPRIDAISALANSTTTFETVIADLNLDETEDDLRSMVIVRPLFANLAVRVTVTDTSPENAAKIARGFVGAIEQLPVPSQTDEGPDYRVQLRLPSTPPSSPTTPKPSHDIVAGGFLGFAAGVIAFTSLRRSTLRAKGGMPRAEQ